MFSNVILAYCIALNFSWVKFLRFDDIQLFHNKLFVFTTNAHMRDHYFHE